MRDLVAGRKYVWITRKRKVSAGYVSSVAREMGLERKRGPQVLPVTGTGQPPDGHHRVVTKQ
jgi:hypothetical protein